MLRLNLKRPKEYVRAVSGLFYSKYGGLTDKEIDILARLLDKCPNGVITQRARDEVIEEMGMKTQNFYNTMSTLKRKRAISGDELHMLFTVGQIKLNYANSSTNHRGDSNEGDVSGPGHTVQEDSGDSD